MIVVNQVLQLHDERIVRVLWMDTDSAYIFDLNSLSLPEKISLKDLFEISEAINDPYLHVLTYEDLPDKYVSKMHENWKVISDIVCAEPNIYITKQRALMIKQTSKITGKNQKNIYEYLKRYWQRGKVKDALLPDYAKCGTGVPNSYNNKVGRKKIYVTDGSNGIAVTPEIEKIFDTVFKEHIKNAERRSIKYSYEKMLTDYFFEEINSDASSLKIPSYGQFYRRFKQKHTPEQIEKAKVGSKKFNKDLRPILGNSTSESNAPGKRYQIDATIADVYLVSEFDCNVIVGRPVIYFCIDVFSRMITGVHVGFNSPSMEEARMAILNCADDKVEFCRGYGYEIDKDDWPVSNMPSCFLGDNGEMRGITPENAIKKFGISLENTGSYRGDMKGIVERLFKSFHDRIKPLVKGYVMPDFQERGAKDYRQESALTLNQFMKVLFAWIVEHHNKYIKNYPPDEEIIKSGINLTPKELWKWGSVYRSGFLRAFPREQLAASLLPHKMAVVTPKGIRLHKYLHYTLPVAVQEGWFMRVDRKSSVKVELVYNPNDLYEVYVNHKGNYLKATPTIGSDMVKYSYEDCLYLEKADKLKKEKHFATELKYKIKSESEISDVVNMAYVESELGKSSKKLNTKNIRENRKLEKALMKSENVFEPVVTSATDVTEQKQEKKDDMFDAIKAIRDKKMRKTDG